MKRQSSDPAKRVRNTGDMWTMAELKVQFARIRIHPPPHQLRKQMKARVWDILLKWALFDRRGGKASEDMGDITGAAHWNNVSGSGVRCTAVRQEWKQKEKWRRRLHSRAVQSMDFEVEHVMFTYFRSTFTYVSSGFAKIRVLFFGLLALIYSLAGLTHMQTQLYV